MTVGIFSGTGLPSDHLCLETSQERGIFSRMGVCRNGLEVLSMGSSVRTCLLRPSPGKSDGRPQDMFHEENLRSLGKYCEKKNLKANDEESQGDIL